ncbi:N-alpha-acetyltransferase 20 [Galdieria sulphuraria]|nr:N-alpha-acetyltransferase 20 [Galdieria sulphuraria]
MKTVICGVQNMTTIRRLSAEDLLHFNSVNLDQLTETFNLGFYFNYLARWPDYQYVVTDSQSTTVAYIIGKAEGAGDLFHGHVSAVTVAPWFRRMGLASLLMEILENVSEKVYQGMYKKLGYIVYRRIIGYYSGEEDAFDMRKSLSKDPERKAMIPWTDQFIPQRLSWFQIAEDEEDFNLIWPVFLSFPTALNDFNWINGSPSSFYFPVQDSNQRKVFS